MSGSASNAGASAGDAIKKGVGLFHVIFPTHSDGDLSADLFLGRWRGYPRQHQRRYR
jgi:hypothetical protein